MSSTPKKPPASGSTASPATAPNTARKGHSSSNSTTTSTNAPPNRSPSRMAAQNNNSITTTSGTGAATTSAAVNRTRSVRTSTNGTPVSARAAARKPADATATADDDAKAEVQAKLDELQEMLNQAEYKLSSTYKHSEVLQVKLEEALQEQSMLEDTVHEQTERVEELEHERKERERGRREMEQIYEAERVAAMKEKEESQIREEEMQSSLFRMREALQQREIRASLGSPGIAGEEEGGRGGRMSLSRTSSSRSNNVSPHPEGSFAPSGLQRSDSRSSSRLVMHKDKIIESLRLELAEAQIKLVELENQGGGHVQSLEKGVYELKMQNARLMEENESFQLLLSEKTLNGDFSAPSPADLLRAPSNQGSRPSTSRELQGGETLADELDGASLDGPDFAASDLGGVLDTKERRLQSEVNGLKDQNKALTLYINNIISRLLQHEQFAEQILDKTPDLFAGLGKTSSGKNVAANMETDLPPPPPPKDERSASAPAIAEEGQVPSLLQRAGSVLRVRGARPPRPTSMMGKVQSAEQVQPKVEETSTRHENPETAPQIPLARSRSTRQAHQHKRSNSDWPAASVVTNMYKGPPPASSVGGPMSPGLGSPTTTAGPRSYFPFGAGSRAPSGSAVPTISETEPSPSKENQDPNQQLFDNKSSNPSSDGVRSDRNSVISNPPLDIDPALAGGGDCELSTTSTSSPPRSTTSSGDRENKQPPGGAIMMGSKPRPLRLVQEAQDDERSKKAANRGSWFGWMNKGAGAGAGGGGGNLAAAFMAAGRSLSEDKVDKVGQGGG